MDLLLILWQLEVLGASKSLTNVRFVSRLI